MFDALLDPADVLDIAERVLGGESVDLAVEAVLAMLTSALGRYLVAPDARVRLETLSERLLDAAEPGSNRQLVAARTYLEVSANSTHITGWLDDSAPAGLTASTDLRWRAVYRLIRNGAVGTAAIEALLEREPSDSAQAWLSRSRAAIPEQAAKDAAWQRIVSDPDIDNHTLYALCEGFWQADQRELTEPYVDRFFDQIGQTADFRSGWIVGYSARLAFPRFAASQHTLERGERAAEEAGLPSGVRRSICDGDDELRRVILSQRRFAG
jgi:aminopeptidase N